jgi:hypothetical protein
LNKYKRPFKLEISEMFVHKNITKFRGIFVKFCDTEFPQIQRFFVVENFAWHTEYKAVKIYMEFRKPSNHKIFRRSEASQYIQDVKHEKKNIFFIISKFIL